MALALDSSVCQISVTKIIFIWIIRKNNGKSVALALIEILQFCHTAATNPFLWDSPTLNWKSQASSTLPRNRWWWMECLKKLNMEDFFSQSSTTSSPSPHYLFPLFLKYQIMYMYIGHECFLNRCFIDIIFRVADLPENSNSILVDCDVLYFEESLCQNVCSFWNDEYV